MINGAYKKPIFSQFHPNKNQKVFSIVRFDILSASPPIPWHLKQ